ncbi:trehalose-phosphatase [Chloroflexota bacterium]
MSYVFNHLDVIEGALRRSHFGLITDVDGTISQTAPTPEQAEVTPLCRKYLSDLCNHLALIAAISGRSAVQVKDMLNIDGMVYVGNHGLEWWRGDQVESPKDVRGYLAAIQAAIETLAPLVSGEGIIIENKGLTASFHYRLSPDRESARQHILAIIAQIPQARGLRVMPERMSVGLLPPVKVDKGTATLDLIHEYNLLGGVYLGDDLTDIDAFRAIHTASHDLDFQGFALGVISQEMPEKLADEADFTLDGVGDVEHFLNWLTQTVLELN